VEDHIKFAGIVVADGVVVDIMAYNNRQECIANLKDAVRREDRRGRLVTDAKVWKVDVRNGNASQTFDTLSERGNN
jgi:hypothetical protein